MMTGTLKLMMTGTLKLMMTGALKLMMTGTLKNIGEIVDHHCLNFFSIKQ
jgi:hypothetical protein